MANKNVSIYIGNTLDAVDSLTVGGTPYSAASVSSLVSNNSSVFSLVANPNGQTDLAFQIDDAIEAVEGSFTEYGTASIYNAQSWDYVGGQPKTRCPRC